MPRPTFSNPARRRLLANGPLLPSPDLAPPPLYPEYPLDGPESGKEPPEGEPPAFPPEAAPAAVVELEDEEFVTEVVALKWSVAQYRRGADGRRRKVKAVAFEEVHLFGSDREEDTNAFGDQIERLLRQSEEQARAKVREPGGE